mmetsp:Transcript_19173/g.37623  ORF Transcript_19173/g.37623 Transcript_19173/m.37623 type:complete len:302 (-) Transcript_19173:715-1620(-)
MKLHKSRETLRAALVAHATALGATKSNGAIDLTMSVDPDSSSIELGSNFLTGLGVRGPDTGTKAILGIVSTFDGFLNSLVRHDWKYRAKLFLINNTHTFLNVTEHRRLDHVSLSILTLGGDLTAVHLGTVVKGINEKLAHTVVLHGVVNRSINDVLVKAIAERGVLSLLYESLKDGIVDRFVHKATLDGNANLATVIEGSLKDASGNLLRISVLEHNSRVITAKLEGDALKGASSVLEDALTRGSASSEGDLVDTRVVDKPFAKLLLLTGDDRENTRREHFVVEASKLKGAKRGVLGGLKN